MARQNRQRFFRVYVSARMYGVVADAALHAGVGYSELWRRAMVDYLKQRPELVDPAHLERADDDSK